MCSKETGDPSTIERNVKSDVMEYFLFSFPTRWQRRKKDPFDRDQGERRGCAKGGYHLLFTQFLPGFRSSDNQKLLEFWLCTFKEPVSLGYIKLDRESAVYEEKRLLPVNTFIAVMSLGKRQWRNYKKYVL